MSHLLSALPAAQGEEVCHSFLQQCLLHKAKKYVTACFRVACSPRQRLCHMFDGSTDGETGLVLHIPNSA